MRTLNPDIAEAIIASIVELADKQIAFKEVPDGDTFILAIVAKDEQGYRPLPRQIAYGSEEAMRINADTLNRARGLSAADVISIVLSSMTKSNRRRVSA